MSAGGDYKIECRGIQKNLLVENIYIGSYWEKDEIVKLCKEKKINMDNMVFMMESKVKNNSAEEKLMREIEICEKRYGPLQFF